MEVIIQSIDFTAGEELESYVKEKMQKLDRLDDKVIRARVKLEKGQGNTNNHLCDVRIEVPGNDHIVKKSGNSYQEALLVAIDTLQDVMRRSKEKQS